MPRRRHWIRGGLLAVALLLAALAAGAAYVMQPIGGWPGVAPVDGADPTRLEAHVRMLAETLAPRSWKRTDKLDRAAAYVAAELRRAGGRVSEQASDVPGSQRFPHPLLRLV